MTAVLLDDESASLRMLQLLLARHCPQIAVLATFESPAEALAQVPDLRPDLVFIDIEMPEMSGFDWLERVQPRDFGVIFVTSYHQFAIKAIKFSAFDYLLKPIDPEELIATMQRFAETERQGALDEKVEVLINNVKLLHHQRFDKIAIPTLKGLIFIGVPNIIRLEAESNYTTFYLADRTKVVASRTLKDFEEMLDDQEFVRIHRSSVINLRHIAEYRRGEGGTVIMSDGSEVEVSRYEKKNFLAKIGG